MKTERHIDWGTEYPIIRWKGYEWQLDAGRKYRIGMARLMNQDSEEE